MSKSKGPTAMADGDWRGRCDADHLMAAQEIHKDPSRLKNASKHLKDLHEESKNKMIAAKSADSKIKQASGAYLKKSKSQPYG